MRNKNAILAALAALVLLACCGAPRQAAAPATAPLLPEPTQVWQLVRMQGRPLPPRQSQTTLIVNPDAATMGGHTPCNTYSFSCDLGNPRQQPDADYYDVSLRLIGSGDIRCSEADMNAEERYLLTLGRATSMRLTATTITLYQKEREILYFELQ